MRPAVRWRFRALDLALLARLAILLAIPSASHRGALVAQDGGTAIGRAAAATAIARAGGARATRSLDGRPGPGYWQQRVDYRLDATLDPARHRLDGSGVVVYHNRSPHAIDTLHWHLYQNLFRPENARRAPPAVVGRTMTTTRGIAVESLSVVRGSSVVPLPMDVRATRMTTPLPTPLAPGDSIVLRVRWTVDLPRRATIRTGSEGEDFGIAQWYPQIAVYDDVRGWDTSQYLGQGEFYLEYGNWDVRFTAPRRWLVAATGTLQNPGEVLTSAQRARLERVSSAAETEIVPAQDSGGRGITAATRTWHFTAQNVRDFALAASPRFVWNATRTAPIAEHPDGVIIHSFYAAPLRHFYAASARIARQAIEYFSRTAGPYVYPQATTVSGPVEGMEYPMLAFEAVESRILGFPEQVTVHELGHQWYPMMIGSDETTFPFMDEGFNTFLDSRELKAVHGPTAGLWQPTLPLWLRGLLGTGDERRFNQLVYWSLSARDAKEPPLLTHADSLSENELGTIGYMKPSAVLFMLQSEIGARALDDALREYHRRWLFRHPYPDDFFRTVEDVSGRDLGWFWDAWFRTPHRMDVAVDSVRRTRDGDMHGATISLERRGLARASFIVRVTLDDGSTRDVRVESNDWTELPSAASADSTRSRGDASAALAPVAGRYELRVSGLPHAVRSVEADPGLVLLERSHANNLWPRNATPAAPPFLATTPLGYVRWVLLALLLAFAARCAGAMRGFRRAGLEPIRIGGRRVLLWSRAEGVRPRWTRGPWLFPRLSLARPRTVATSADELRARTALAIRGGLRGPIALGGCAVVLLLLLDVAYRFDLRHGSRFTLDGMLALIVMATVLLSIWAIRPRFSRGLFREAPLLTLGRRGARAERWSAAHALMASSHAGVRPRDWDPSLVEWLQPVADESLEAAGAALLAYYHALDRGDDAESERMLDRADTLARGWLRRRARRIVAAERTYRHAMAGDVTAAAAAHARMSRRGRPQDRPNARANLALAHALGDRAAAERELRTARAQLDRLTTASGAGIAAMEAELIEAIEQRFAIASQAPIADAPSDTTSTAT